MRSDIDSVLKTFDQDFLSGHMENLRRLVRIPSVSFPGFDPAEVTRSAEEVAKILTEAGLENVQLLKTANAPPYVYGDWLHAPGKPTLLLYAHHDVQPPGREELWKSPPFEPTELEGPGGSRLFGRGSADDKAGVIVHSSAIASYLKTHGELPVNVKVLIEGEEEVGSGHLEQFLKDNLERVQADILVLTDTLNYDIGTPGLTTALRGLVALEVEVRGLTKAVHSGMWGGPIPDPVLALSKTLAALVDENGKIAIPGFWDLIPPIDPIAKEALKLLPPVDESTFREQSGLIEKADLLHKDQHLMGQIWWTPALSVNAIQASSRKQAGNIINDVAWAKVGIRIPPGTDARKVMACFRAAIENNVPWNLEVKITEEVAAGGWSTQTEHPVFELARAAMREGYGKDPVLMGCGGSIPFVQPFAEALGGAPALLVGVEDPYTNAHGENESLLIEDFRKACISQIHLFDKIGRS